MKKTLLSLVGVALAASALFMAPSALADGLAGIGGWEPVPNECGSYSTFPVLVSNATGVTQTGSITVPEGLSAQVGVYNSYAAISDSLYWNPVAASCNPNRPELMSAPEYQYNFTVPAGQTQVFWMGLGGVDYNLIGNSHSFGVGGLPSGASGASWYDFYLSLNAIESFTNLNIAYSGTGGTNTDNHQNGFNIVQCSTAGGNLNPTGSILTPFSSGTNNSLNYGRNQPICMGWVPVGTMVPLQAVWSSNGNSIVPIAAQYNQANGVGTVSVAGTLPAGVTLVSAQAANSSNVNPSIATATPNAANGWVVTSGTSWALVDYPIANFGVNFGCLILLQASDGSLVQVSISGIPGT
jgi:hypothetical protein